MNKKIFSRDNKTKSICYNNNAEGTSALLFDNEIWWTTEETAKYLKRSVGQIRNMVYRNQIQSEKFLSRRYFNKYEVINLVGKS